MSPVGLTPVTPTPMTPIHSSGVAVLDLGAWAERLAAAA